MEGLDGGASHQREVRRMNADGKTYALARLKVEVVAS